MQTMELVNIEDVYPYEVDDVRMNPRDVGSRECREYIEQLAEQFRYNKLNPGQPRVRPILYRDGGIYQIIDGECRYEAMRLIGTKRFLADVFDDLEDAELARQEAAKAMVETDAKRALTAEEMSRGVQQMLALDVPEEEVAAVARVDAGKVRRARRGARAVSDAAYDMTLDRLAAIAEFEGDGEAVAKLRDCPQREWQRVYEGLRANRNMEEARALAVETMEEAGLAPAGDDPSGYRRVGASIYIDGSSDPEKVAARVASEIEARLCTHYTAEGHWIELMRPSTPEDDALDEEEREKRDELDRARMRHVELWDVEAASRERWLAEGLGDMGSIRSTAALLADRAMELGSGLVERTGAEVDFSPTPALAAIGWGLSWSPDKFVAAQAAMGRLHVYSVDPGNASRFVELCDAMEADGYEPNETGAAVAAALREWSEKNGR